MIESPKKIRVPKGWSRVTQGLSRMGDWFNKFGFWHPVTLRQDGKRHPGQL